MWHPVIIFLDTHSEFSVVSSTLLEDIGFTGPWDKSKTTKAVSLEGKVLEMNTRVELRWQLYNSTRTYKSRFIVVENPPLDLSVGRSVINDRRLLSGGRHSLPFLRVTGRTEGMSRPMPASPRTCG